MKPAFCSYVGFMSFFWRCKGADMYMPICRIYLSNPFLLGFIQADTHKAAFIRLLCFPLILAVYLMRNIPQIVPFVVRFSSIDVVDFIYRPFSSHVKPCKTMRPMAFAQQFYIYVPLDMECAGYFADLHGITRFKNPREYPRFRIVMQQLFESFLSQRRIAFAHYRSFETLLGSDARGLQPLGVALA